MTVAPSGPVASTLMFVGRVRTGAVVSRTLTVKLAETELPAASVAVQWTGVDPIENSEPLAEPPPDSYTSKW